MKRNNGKMKKAMAGVMATTMMLSLAACGNKETAEVPADENKALANTDQAKNGDLTDTIEDAMGLSTNTDADKDETVYVIADAKGKGTKTIVDEWLKNPDKKNTLDDVSSLTDIENVKGDETFEQNGDKVTWEANGNPIYYQGTTNQEVPVGVNVKYYMDDKEVEPDDIAGKSGKVKIRFEYTNTAKSGDVYTPFVMATGLVLDGSNFSNVSVSNGKVVSDGDKFIVVGMGMPGLNESLDIDGLDTTFPDYFEITADTSDFELDMSVTVASANFLGTDSDKELDIDDAIDEVDDLSGQYSSGMDALVEGIQEYTDGVGQVKDGADKLYDGADQVKSGADQVSDGAASAYSGSTSLKNGLDTALSGSESLANGASSLSSGASAVGGAVDQLATGSATAATGASRVSTGATNLKNGIDQYTAGTSAAATGSSALKDGVDQLSEGASQLNGVATYTAGVDSISTNLSALNSAMTQVTDGADSLATGSAQVYAGLQSLETQVGQLSTTLSTKYTKGVTQDTVDSAMGVCVAKAEAYANAVKNTPEDLTDDGQAMEELKSAINTYSAYQTALKVNEVITAVNGGLTNEDGTSKISALIDGAKSVSEGATTLQTALETGDGTNPGVQPAIAALSKGAGELSNNSGTINNGITALSSGISDLSDGASKLNTGLSKIVSNNETLTTGASDLSTGASQLSTGLGTLNTGLSTLQSKAPSLISGAQQVSNGASTLQSGLTTLDTGAGTLNTGLKTLSSGANSLSSGAGQLKSGTAELKSGVDTLDSNSAALNDGAAELQDATQQILDKLDSAESDATKLVDNINEMKSAASAYQSFGGINSDMKGNVKFVIKTAAVTTDSKN